MKTFPYHNGVEMVYGDPLGIRRKLTLDLGGDINAAIAKLSSEDAIEAAEAGDRVLVALRSALGMVPFDISTGVGATDEDCYAAFDAWIDYEEKKNQRAAISPISSQPTEAAS